MTRETRLPLLMEFFAERKAHLISPRGSFKGLTPRLTHISKQCHTDAAMLIGSS